MTAVFHNGYGRYPFCVLQFVILKDVHMTAEPQVSLLSKLPETNPSKLGNTNYLVHRPPTSPNHVSYA